MKKSVLVVVLTAALGVGVLAGMAKSKLKEPPKIVATVPAKTEVKEVPDWCPRLILATFTAYKAFNEGHSSVTVQAAAREVFKEFNSQVVAETAYYAYTQGWDKDQLVKHVEGNCTKYGKPVAKN